MSLKFILLRYSKDGMISVPLKCVNVRLIVVNSAIAYNSAHQALILPFVQFKYKKVLFKM